MATQPKLAMIPSGYKDGKLYSALPTDGAGDFDITRGSDATRINKDGLIETVTGNTPRLNYPLIDGVVNGCPSLLLEPQTTNLITQSNQFDTTWISVNVTLNSIQTGVGGSNDAWEATSTSGVDYLRYNSSNWLGDTTFSVYAKAGTLNSILMTGFGNTYFNLETGVVGTSSADSAKMESMGNGWYRCSVVGNTSPSQVRLYPSDSENTNAIGSIYIQNSQVEQSSYATSYIPTSGSAQTRLADTASKTVPDGVINSSEGTWFFNIADLANGTDYKQLSISNESYNNNITIFSTTVKNKYVVQAISGGSTQVNVTLTLADTTAFNKIAIKWKLNDFAIWINGVEVYTNSSYAVISESILYRVAFSGFSGASIFYGKCKDLRVYKTALTALEIETLTSYTSFNAMALALNYTIQ